MSDRDEAHPDLYAKAAERLVHWGKAYQEAIWEWRISRDPARSERLLMEQALALEQIYLELKADLHKLIYGWSGSRLFQERLTTQNYREAADTIAISLLGTIAAKLPALRLDPQLNVRGLLTTIARRDLYDQEYKIYRQNPHQHTNQHPLASGDPDAAMWSSPHEWPGGVWYDEGDSSVFVEPEDATSTDFEDRLITRDLAIRCWPRIKDLWQRELSAVDWNIITLRWSADPPVPFAEIAQHLGPGWTMGAVKMRHHRILRHTRAYLVEQKVLEVNG
jgi:hypothetical protein